MNILMNSFFVILFILLTIQFFIKMNKKMISKKNFMNKLECGFNNINNFKINYSMNFTYILIIFIMFDIELMILIPMILNLKIYIYMIKMINLFILFMMLTTILELKNKKMLWMI